MTNMTRTQKIRKHFPFMLTPEYKAEKARCLTVQRAHRVANGFKATNPKLLSTGETITKLDKSETAIYGLALAQSRLSGYNECANSTPDCVASCVGKNGNGAFKGVQKARVVKTLFRHEHSQEFGFLMADEIRLALIKHDGKCEFRLNTFSDEEWQDIFPEWFTVSADFHAYDYTKNWSRVSKFGNYSLCYSVTERTTDEQMFDKLDAGENIALVINVRGGYIANTTTLREIPTSMTINGKTFAIIDGDKEENRASDAPGSIIGLRAKGSMVHKKMARNVSADENGTLQVMTYADHLVAWNYGPKGKASATAVTIGKKAMAMA